MNCHWTATGCNAIELYSDDNKLTINAAKSKILMFPRGKIRNLPIVAYKGNTLDAVHAVQDLGTSYTGKKNDTARGLGDRENACSVRLYLTELKPGLVHP